MAKSRKSKTPWLLIIAGAMVVGYWWLKQQIDLIQVGSISIPFQKLDGTTLVLGLKLPIVNASAIAVNVTGFAGYILTPSGAVLSTVFLNRPAHVARYAQTELEFTSNIRATDLATEIFSIIASGQKLDFKGYRIKGQLRIYGIPLPIESNLL